MKITFNTGTFDYAASELRDFFGKYTNATFGNGGERSVNVTTDPALPAHVYKLDGDGKTLNVTGGSRSAALSGIYAAFKRAGVVFHAGGSFLAGKFDADAFFSAKAEVRPRFRLRGVRQHINFPMDISSYPLGEAKEYIRDMARLGFNAMTFHSYGDQWHPVTPGKTFAGHFFYGQRHPLPKDEILRERIRNRREYVNPEAEELMEKPEELASYVEYWLREVIATAKKAEMTVTLSVELPCNEEGAIRDMLAYVSKTYPQIDVLELISAENETTAKSFTNEEIADLLGKEALESDGTLTHAEELGENLPAAFRYCIEFLGRVRTAIRTKDEWTKGLAKVPSLRIGIYNTNGRILKAIRPILRRVFPDIPYSYLPAHGSKAVVDNMNYMGVGEADFADTMFYTWAEFDGNMFLQQLANTGLEMIAEMAPQDSFGVCINHWRTAENTLAVTYAAETFREPLTSEEFYRKAAKVLALDEELLPSALLRMERLDVFCRDRLFNIGFCFYGGWSRTPGIAMVARLNPEYIDHARSEYTDLIAIFEKILSTAATEEGIALARLWINRLTCSVFHLDAMKSMKRVEASQDKATVTAAFSDAARYAHDYALLYSEFMPDRGGEGQTVSYIETIARYVDTRRDYYLGLAAEAEAATFDAPPVPQEMKEQA